MTERLLRPRARSRWRRRVWPLAPALLVVAGVGSLVADPWAASDATLAAVTVLPLSIAIVVSGLAIGGRRGLTVALLLAGLAIYWAWWFGWGLDANISPLSVGLALTGLADAAVYELSLLITLWPLALLAAVTVAAVRWRRDRPIGPALGILALAVVVLSFPARATWNDGCNDTSGAAPLVTAPVTGPLMDHGIGVLPGGSQTAMLCAGVGNRTWKPFWLGDDHLPPGPAIYGTVGAGIQIPKRLYRTPEPLPGGRLDRVSLMYWPERDNLYVVVATDRELATGRPSEWPPIQLEINGTPFDDDEGLGVRGTRRWCYSAVWVGTVGRPQLRQSKRLRVDLVHQDRRLASGTARVEPITSDEQGRLQGERFGCPPKW